MNTDVIEATVRIHQTRLHFGTDAGNRIPDSFSEILLSLMRLADEYGVDFERDLEVARTQFDQCTD